MTTTVAVFGFALAMTLANLSVAAFGPWVSPINALLLIGLDLALRDWLHVKLRTWQMGAMIVATGVVSYVLNPAAQQIALASSLSFAAAALADWLVFVRLPGSWFRRSAGSNVAGAAVDSALFPLLAFGALMPHIVLLQFVAKVAGGTVWAWVLSRGMARPQRSGQVPPRPNPPTPAPDCDLAPPGWVCIRDKGHEGPCAAAQIEHDEPACDSSLVADLEHRAKWWRQARIDRVSVDNVLAEDFARELDRAVAALRPAGLRVLRTCPATGPGCPHACTKHDCERAAAGVGGTDGR